MKQREKEVAWVWVFLAIGILCMLFTGCVWVSETEYYENGQVKRKYERSGFVEWSDAEGKQMPLSHLSVIGK